MKKNASGILFGVVFISAAIILFGNAMQWWNINNFNGWWTLFLIIPGIASIVSYGFSLWSLGLIVVGGWLLADAQGWLPKALSHNFFWIVVFLFIGLNLIFGSFKQPKVPKNPVFMQGINGASDANNFVNYSAVFGGVEVSNNSQTLYGGKLSAIFGGVTLDLRQAVPVDGSVIEANAVFGGIDIYAPQNCRLIITGVPFFGGADCKAVLNNDPSLPLLTIRYNAIFGGVDII